MDSKTIAIGVGALAIVAVGISMMSGAPTQRQMQITATFKKIGLVATTGTGIPFVVGAGPQSGVSLDEWARSVIADIDKIIAPNGTFIVFRPGEEYRSATDALKAARSDLGAKSTWFLSLRDVGDEV